MQLSNQKIKVFAHWSGENLSGVLYYGFDGNPWSLWLTDPETGSDYGCVSIKYSLVDYDSGVAIAVSYGGEKFKLFFVNDLDVLYDKGIAGRSV